MKKSVTLALIASAATMAVPSVVFAAESSQSVQAAAEEVAAPVEVNAGQMLYSADGKRIAKIYRVNEEGSPQIIMDGRLITVPASTLTDMDGKVATSLSKRDVARTR